MVIQVVYCYQMPSQESHTLIGEVQLFNCLVDCRTKLVLYCITPVHNIIFILNQLPIHIQHQKLSLQQNGVTQTRPSSAHHFSNTPTQRPRKLLLPLTPRHYIHRLLRLISIELELNSLKYYCQLTRHTSSTVLIIYLLVITVTSAFAQALYLTHGILCSVF